ncbi:MAG: hypothetical protein AAF984_04990 [Verrucomicrobiota bacterium]
MKIKKLLYVSAFIMLGVMLVDSACALPTGTDALDITLKRVRRKEHAKGQDYDDQRQTISFTIKVENKNAFEDTPKVKLQVKFIGEVMNDRIRDRSLFKILRTDKLKIKPIDGGEDFVQELADLELVFDESNYARKGDRYFCYAARIISTKGEVIYEKTDKPTLIKDFDRLWEIKDQAYFDKDLYGVPGVDEFIAKNKR